MDIETARFNMVEQQIRPWEVLDANVLGACTKIPRERFVPDAYRQLAFCDTAIDIGQGQTMMPPKLEARLQARVAGFTLLTQVSQGGFDAAGLAPVRFTDQRARKAAKAANFQRDVGKITFSGSRDEFALAAGSQDRLSWMIQLPAVLAAEPKRAAPGGEVLLYVAGVRADVALWTVRYAAVETIDTAAGPIRTVKFMRERDDPKDTLAEVWLDPTRHYLPVRARLTHGDDEAFELVLRAAPATR